MRGDGGQSESYSVSSGSMISSVKRVEVSRSSGSTDDPEYFLDDVGIETSAVSTNSSHSSSSSSLSKSSDVSILKKASDGVSGRLVKSVPVESGISGKE